MHFVAIDVEIANASFASICQVGVVVYVGGVESRRWECLVDPEDFFSETNISIHGITEEAVSGSHNIPALLDNLRVLLAGNIVVSHTNFDRTALHQWVVGRSFKRTF